MLKYKREKRDFRYQTFLRRFLGTPIRSYHDDKPPVLRIREAPKALADRQSACLSIAKIRSSAENDPKENEPAGFEGRVHKG